MVEILGVRRLVLFAALFLPVFCTIVTQLIFLWDSKFGYTIVAAISYAVVAFFIGKGKPQNPWLRLLAVYGLLPVGMFLDAMLHIDLHSYSYDRNMLPFEILYFALVVPIPIIFGGLLGREGLV